MWDALDEVFLGSEKSESSLMQMRTVVHPGINIWRCHFCHRLHVFQQKETHLLSNLYHPDELLWSEETPSYSSLLSAFPWGPAQKAGAEFYLGYSTAEQINFSPGELTRNQHWTNRFQLEVDPWEVWVTALPDGGLISYHSGGGWFEHHLYSQTAFSGALETLALPRSQIRQMRLWAWAKARASSDDDLDAFFRRADSLREHL